ncbi:SurA N-terminal domain-containing protein [Streptomyces sp. RFCAC02]|uniref:SurA N-terminal domain-containing protein n=1 Tax=Streptomyces sp. RFCAC02 TaxID=2499143 RepID=UPI00101FC166|nr:SurA N-terminal domain-containing protein [Streptomyces sp. RFCAC02]
MKRRASVLSLTAAAAVTALLATGCSTGAHPGAAAVVGGERITVASVQAQVEAVRDAQRAQPNGDELIAASGSLTRDTVDFLVYYEVLERAAADAGVEVSRRDVQQARSDAEDTVGSPEALAQVALLAQAGGLPLAGDEQLDRQFRGQVLFQRLAERIGATGSPNGRQMIVDVLARTAEEIGVEVNPRYGEWSPEQVALIEADQPWLTGTADGTAA